MSVLSACPRCGTAVAADARFCGACGVSILPPGVKEDHLFARLRHATLGEYEIIRSLGEGGMAAVYLAWDLELARYVAIKVMFPDLAHREAMPQRFLQEARTAANLDDHPNVVRVYRAKESAGLRYFVMKFIDGCSLDHLLHLVEMLPVGLACVVLDQVARALHYAHERGVVHRDVKPGNVMLDRSGHALVTDFGIAKVAQGEHLTRTGFAIGTPAYMSPEQWGADTPTSASDQYALGIIAYQLLTGKPPFEGSLLEMLQQHLHVPPAPIRSSRHDCPPALEAAVLRMLAKQRGDRWPSLADVIPVLDPSTFGDPAVLRATLGTMIPAATGTDGLPLPKTPQSPVPLGRAISGEAPGIGPRRDLGSPYTPVSGAPVVTPSDLFAPVPRPAAVRVTVDRPRLTVGARARVAAAVVDASGNTLPNCAVSWWCEPASLASVDRDGTLTPMEAGSVRIVASHEQVRGDVTLVIDEDPKVVWERAERARLEAERAEEVRRAAEQAERARLEAERAERARLEAERAEQAQLEAERRERARMERERLERERLERERLERERREQARLEAERAEKARQEAERAERARVEAERTERARLEAERRETERAEKARVEAARKNAERAEKQRLEAERAERARREAEQREAERAEKARLDAERAARAQAEAERAEQARVEAERQERARREAVRAQKERREAEQRLAAQAEKQRLEAERAEQKRRKAEVKAAAAAAAQAAKGAKEAARAESLGGTSAVASRRRATILIVTNAIGIVTLVATVLLLTRSGPKPVLQPESAAADAGGTQRLDRSSAQSGQSPADSTKPPSVSSHDSGARHNRDSTKVVRNDSVSPRPAPVTVPLGGTKNQPISDPTRDSAGARVSPIPDSVIQKPILEPKVIVEPKPSGEPKPSNEPKPSPESPPPPPSLSAEQVKRDVERIAGLIRQKDEKALGDLMGRTGDGASNRNDFLTWMRKTPSIGASPEPIGAIAPADGRATADFQLTVRWQAFGPVKTKQPSFRATWKRDGTAWTLVSLTLLTKFP